MLRSPSNLPRSKDVFNRKATWPCSALALKPAGTQPLNNRATDHNTTDRPWTYKTKSQQADRMEVRRRGCRVEAPFEPAVFTRDSQTDPVTWYDLADASTSPLSRERRQPRIRCTSAYVWIGTLGFCVLATVNGSSDFERTRNLWPVYIAQEREDFNCVSCANLFAICGK